MKHTTTATDPAVASPCIACGMLALPEELTEFGFCRACWLDTLAASMTSPGRATSYLLPLLSDRGSPDSVKRTFASTAAKQVAAEAQRLRSTMAQRVAQLAADKVAARAAARREQDDAQRIAFLERQAADFASAQRRAEQELEQAREGKG